MRIDFTQKLQNIDGTDMEYSTRQCPQCGQAIDGVSWTLRLACTSALVAQHADPRTGQPIQLKGDDHVKRYALAIKIHENDELDLTPKQLTLIQECIAKTYRTLIAGQVCRMLGEKEEAGEG